MSRWLVIAGSVEHLTVGRWSVVGGLWVGGALVGGQWVGGTNVGGSVVGGRRFCNTPGLKWFHFFSFFRFFFELLIYI